MWPAQVPARLAPQQPGQVGTPEGSQHGAQQYTWQRDPHWQQYVPAQHPHHVPGQHSNITSPTTSRSGGLSSQHSGEQTSRR